MKGAIRLVRDHDDAESVVDWVADLLKFGIDSGKVFTVNISEQFLPVIGEEYKWEYVCPHCMEVMLYRKEALLSGDDPSSMIDGAIYPDGKDVLGPDSTACRSCNRHHLISLDNFRERAMLESKEEHF